MAWCCSKFEVNWMTVFYFNNGQKTHFSIMFWPSDWANTARNRTISVDSPVSADDYLFEATRPQIDQFLANYPISVQPKFELNLAITFPDFVCRDKYVFFLGWQKTMTFQWCHGAWIQRNIDYFFKNLSNIKKKPQTPGLCVGNPPVTTDQ